LANVTLQRAKTAKGPALEQFKRLGNVVGVGITRVGDDYAVKVNLSAPLAPGVAAPTEIAGVPVRVEVTGLLSPRFEAPAA
jgi:hypothetical protein